MTRDKDKESDDDIEDDIFGFLQFFLVSSWNQDEPSCIDDEEDTENGEEGIEIIDKTSDDTDTFLEVLALDSTATRPEEVSFLTVGFPIDRRDKCSGKTDEEKADKCVDHDIFPFF